MSGVFGLIDQRGTTDTDSFLRTAAAAMSHRPWYRAEFWQSGDQTVGLGRLGIGIFNREPQPVLSEDGQVALMMAGELYETGALRRQLETGGMLPRSDSHLELALCAYRLWGDLFASHLEGVFIIALHDAARRQVLLTNDRFGVYPLLYAHYEGRLVFAPEMKAILSAPGFKPEIDWMALADYAHFQHVLGDRTFLDGLKLLPSASALSCQPDSGQLRILTYWGFKDIPYLSNITFEEAVDEGARLLQRAVQRRTGGDYRMGAYLSGGMDSRIILGFMQHEDIPVTTITYGLPNSRDVQYSRRIAQKLGTHHHYFEITDGRWVIENADLHLALTEGFHSWIHMHGIQIGARARSLIDINLNGFGGGELNWEDSALIYAADDTAFRVRLFRALSQDLTWPALDDLEYQLTFSAPLRPRMTDLAYESVAQAASCYEQMDYERRAAAMSFDSDHRLFQYYTVFNRAFLEQRFPFLDYHYFEFVRATPSHMHFRRKLRRAIILKALPHLASIPYDKDDLPITGSQLSLARAKVIQRGKKWVHHYFPNTFTPYSSLYVDYEGWLRSDLKSWGEEILLGQRTSERGIFDMTFLGSLWRRHQSGHEVNFIGKIAPLMTWEMMARRFLD